MSDDTRTAGGLDALDDSDPPGRSRVVSVHVEGLVGRDKPLTLKLADDHPVLLTGSSGSGKSTLLRGIHAVATGNFPLLATLPMRRLLLERDGASDIVVERQQEGIQLTIGDDKFPYQQGAADPKDDADDRFEARGLPRLLRMDGGLTTRVAYEALRAYFAGHVRREAPWLSRELAELSIPYVADDRLFALADQDVPSPIRDHGPHGYRARPFGRSFRSVDRIDQELFAQWRSRAVQASAQISAIDQGLPGRVIAAVRGQNTGADAVTSEIAAIDALQDRLDRFGLGSTQQSTFSILEGDGDDRERAVLLAVLGSYHSKLSAWKPFLEDLERFVNAVNRRFRRKRLEYSPRGGLRVVLEDQPVFPEFHDAPATIRLDMLSSGEQHLVVLLYRLIFGSPNGSLFLVDEPELSLHVAWQRELASDLADIAAHKESRFLIATHSPSVIAGHLDWEINFDDLDADG